MDEPNYSHVVFDAVTVLIGAINILFGFINGDGILLIIGTLCLAVILVPLIFEKRRSHER